MYRARSMTFHSPVLGTYFLSRIQLWPQFWQRHTFCMIALVFSLPLDFFQTRIWQPQSGDGSKRPGGVVQMPADPVAVLFRFTPSFFHQNRYIFALALRTNYLCTLSFFFAYPSWTRLFFLLGFSISENCMTLRWVFSLFGRRITSDDIINDLAVIWGRRSISIEKCIFSRCHLHRR